MAEATFLELLAHIPEPTNVAVDSAGTDSYHELDPPDDRTLATLARHGFGKGYDHVARRVTADDLRDFDYVLVMDRHNYSSLRRKRAAWHANRARKGSSSSSNGPGEKDNIFLFGDFDESGSAQADEVVDPYYGGNDGFEIVFQQCVCFSQGWIERLLGWKVAIDPKGKITATKIEK